MRRDGTTSKSCTENILAASVRESPRNGNGRQMTKIKIAWKDFVLSGLRGSRKVPESSVRFGFAWLNNKGPFGIVGGFGADVL